MNGRNEGGMKEEERRRQQRQRQTGPRRAKQGPRIGCPFGFPLKQRSSWIARRVTLLVERVVPWVRSIYSSALPSGRISRC